MIHRTIGIAGSVVLLVCGVVMLVLGDHARSTVRSNYTIDSNEPRHLVTEAMTSKTRGWSQRQAPHFEVPDYQGKPVEIAKAGAGKAQFVYFIVDQCPCSVDAEPFFQRLWERYGRRVDFIAVTDGEPKRAQIWASLMKMPYALVPDPKLKVVRAFGATNSVFSALIDRGGKIVRMWPGYSRDILTEMNEEMARTTGEPLKPFDVQYAPVKRATGCAFAL